MINYKRMIANTLLVSMLSTPAFAGDGVLTTGDVFGDVLGIVSETDCPYVLANDYENVTQQEKLLNVMLSTIMLFKISSKIEVVSTDYMSDDAPIANKKVDKIKSKSNQYELPKLETRMVYNELMRCIAEQIRDVIGGDFSVIVTTNIPMITIISHKGPMTI